MPLSKMVGNLLRTQEILLVLFRKGFGDLLERMGLAHYLKAERPEDQEGVARSRDVRSTAVRFREALEELGGAFVKLGQLLSTRPDILPRAWIEELSRLQDDVKAVEFHGLLETLESDLGPWAEKFQSIDLTPLAAGSIAQVHLGVTREGHEVAIKIRKPGIRKTMLQDCDILMALAELLEKHVAESRNYRPVQMVEEFRNAVIQELDFTQEGRNLDRFRADFPDHPVVVFPQPFWDQTTERVLTMERIQGIKISLVHELMTRNVDTVAVARSLADAVLRQVLEHGFFHGDPHPGNLMVVNESKVCFLDCGMVGRLDERMRENLILLVAAGIRKDVESIVDIMIEMNAPPENLDRVRFLKEATLFLDRYYRLPLKRIRFSSLVDEIVDLVNHYQILIPNDLVLVGKALITLEGVGRSLDPDFDAVAVAEPFIREMALTTYGPKYIARKFIQGSRDVLRLIQDLPGDLRELSRTLRTNQLRIALDHQGLREALQELDRAAKRLSTSIVAASIVLGSSIIFLSGSGPRYLDIPILAIVGFCVAACLGLWSIIASFFEKRRRG